MSVTELEEYRAVIDRPTQAMSHYALTIGPASRGHERRSYAIAARLLDISGACFGLVLTLPVMGIVALAVKATSKGPAVFNQLRVGKDGRLFRCYKFRTMVVDAEAVLDRNPELKAEFAFLRKTSLDELPQFVNVLLGDMSLVGPRPIVPAELAKYGDDADKLVTVKPGLTGLWQVSGRSETTYEERVELDMKYIASRTILGDIGLILKTVLVTLQRKGAC